MEEVTWYDAVQYCNMLSAKNGLNSCYTINGTNVTCDFSKNGFRLPTEAEWEYAAKGGRQNRGMKYAGSNSPDEVAWYRDNSGGKTHPVGQKQANEMGLYDMSGNVFEWCWDLYGVYSASSQTDPEGALSETYRVLRGGSWEPGADHVRTAFRACAPTAEKGYNSSRSYDFGFRVVRRP